MSRICFSLLVCILPVLCFAQPSKQDIKEWYESGSWLNGVARTPSGPLNRNELFKQYNANKAAWDKAMNFLKNTNLDTLTPGKHLIDGENIYALVSAGNTKPKDSVLFEAHHRYIDVQCVISGEELIGVAPYAKAVEKKPYDEAKDIAFYTANGKFFKSNSGTVFIMFPEKDAHCGGIIANGQPAAFKKVTVKIRTVQ